VFAPSALAQVCSADPITLSSQADVDNFQTTYGPCDFIAAALTISGNDITTLSGLSGLTGASAPGRIAIASKPALTQLDGLSGLTGVYWLDILSNAALANIDGLSNVVSGSGPVIISGNALLTNVNGLSGLSVLPGRQFRSPRLVGRRWPYPLC